MYIELFDELIENEFKLNSVSNEIIEISEISSENDFKKCYTIIEYFILRYDLNLKIFIASDESDIILKHY